ncbi:hypothetical protein AMTR_s00055p00068740 [Amborella trichopoda]|uniref:Uncharacterized protein n=1 Tax=Amborella trichopoda TaxID=13333 RepID=U5CY10_AMBTC|nr:hypothetical protein AMTR_s00055p00068740 [Amborella trichopoda]
MGPLSFFSPRDLKRHHGFEEIFRATTLKQSRDDHTLWELLDRAVINEGLFNKDKALKMAPIGPSSGKDKGNKNSKAAITTTIIKTAAPTKFNSSQKGIRRGSFRFVSVTTLIQVPQQA